MLHILLQVRPTYDYCQWQTDGRGYHGKSFEVRKYREKLWCALYGQIVNCDECTDDSQQEDEVCTVTSPEVVPAPKYQIRDAHW